MTPTVDPSDVIIAPTILTSDASDFAKKIELYPSFAKRIQIDIIDGSFVPTTTISESVITALPENVDIDFHMMVARPSEHLNHILRLKPKLAIFHAESAENLLPIFERLKQAGIRCGVALLQRTYPGSVESYIKAADHALIFAGSLGKNGGSADLIQTEKVKIIRRINPKITIGWDGGANIENIRTLAHSDIEVINVGSAIADADNPRQAYEDLREEALQRGVRV